MMAVVVLKVGMVVDGYAEDEDGRGKDVSYR